MTAGECFTASSINTSNRLMSRQMGRFMLMAGHSLIEVRKLNNHQLKLVG
jgi:hypothetical protein